MPSLQCNQGQAGRQATAPRRQGRDGPWRAPCTWAELVLAKPVSSQLCHLSVASQTIPSVEAKREASRLYIEWVRPGFGKSRAPWRPGGWVREKGCAKRAFQRRRRKRMRRRAGFSLVRCVRCVRTTVRHSHPGHPSRQLIVSRAALRCRLVRLVWHPCSDQVAVRKYTTQERTSVGLGTNRKKQATGEKKRVHQKGPEASMGLCPSALAGVPRR